MDALLLGYISADHFVYSCAVWSQVYANNAAKMADRVNTVQEYRYSSSLWKKQVENASRRYYKWKRKFSSCSHSWWVFKRLNWCSWKFDKVHLTDERLTVKHFYHYFPDDVNRNGKPLLCCFVKSLLER